MSDQVETQEPNSEQENQNSAFSPNLTLQDLTVVAQMIQVLNQRGAFRAEELVQVGSLYNKIVNFLEATGAISRPEPSDDKSTAVDDSAGAQEQQND